MSIGDINRKKNPNIVGPTLGGHYWWDTIDEIIQDDASAFPTYFNISNQFTKVQLIILSNTR